MCHWSDGFNLRSEEQDIFEAEDQFKDFGPEADQEAAKNLGRSVHTIRHVTRNVTLTVCSRRRRS